MRSCMKSLGRGGAHKKLVAIITTGSAAAPSHGSPPPAMGHRTAGHMGAPGLRTQTGRGRLSE